MSLFLLLGLSQVSLATSVEPIHIVFHCSTTKNKTISVFKQGQNVFYQYGASLTKPELALMVTEEKVFKQPWNGVGSSFWNSMTFQNQDYRYSVSSSYNRNEGTLEYAGVSIQQNDKTIANVDCNLKSGLIDNLADFIQSFP